MVFSLTENLGGVKPIEISVKKDPFTNKVIKELEIDPKYIFGYQNAPTPSQLLRQTAMSITNPIGARRIIQQEIDEHNEQVMKRAQLLTMYDKQGVDIPPHVVLSGAVDSVAKVIRPVVGSGFQLPSFWTPIPTGGIDVSPQIRGWSQTEIADYVINGGYADYLANGGIPIPELTEAYGEHFISQFGPFGEGEEDESDVDLDKNGEELDENGGELDDDVEIDPEVVKRTPRSIFNEMMKNKTSTRIARTIWTNGGAVWFNDYYSVIGRPRNMEELSDLEEAFLDNYNVPPPRTPLTEVPDVEREYSTADEEEEEEEEQPPRKKPQPAHPPLVSDEPVQLIHESDDFIQWELDMGVSKQQALADWEIFKNSGFTRFRNPTTGKMQAVGVGRPGDDPPPPSIEGPKKPGIDGKPTSTKGDEPHPDFTHTKIDVDDDESEEDDDPPPPLPIDDDPDDPDKPKKPKKKEDEEKDKKSDGGFPLKKGVGYLRPLFERGAQDVLLLTDKEKLQEIKDWDLFDLPIPTNEDVSNPMYMKQIRDLNARFFGPNGNYRPKNLYRSEPPVYVSDKTEQQRIDSMEPIMRQQHIFPATKAEFYDPFDRTPYFIPNDTYRTHESTGSDSVARAGTNYPELARALPSTPLSDLFMSMK